METRGRKLKVDPLSKLAFDEGVQAGLTRSEDNSTSRADGAARSAAIAIAHVTLTFALAGSPLRQK